jgi:hypothetical protein
MAVHDGSKALRQLLYALMVLPPLCLLLSCSMPLTDQRLTSEFNIHKETFDELAALSDLQNLDCRYPNDPDICVPKGSDKILADLKRQTGWRDLQLYVRKRPSYALWMPVQVTGVLSTSTSVVGYVYSHSEMSPQVKTVWRDLEEKEAYKRIADGWYLFISN